MNRQKKDVCPGCSRHCTADAVRCKRGRRYFEKQREQAQADNRRKRYKWEKYVMPEGTLWKILYLSARVKKSLKRGDITEAQILNALTGEEREALGAALGKMDGILEKMHG